VGKIPLKMIFGTKKISKGGGEILCLKRGGNPKRGGSSAGP